MLGDISKTVSDQTNTQDGQCALNGSGQTDSTLPGVEVDKLSICLISQEYPPETNWGGIATYTQVLARQLAKLGHKVRVLTLTDAAEYDADDHGVTVHRLSRNPRVAYDPTDVGNMKHGILDLSQRFYEKALEIHQAEPFDVIEAPETCAQALIIFKNLKRVAKVTRLHTPFFWVRHLNNMPDTPEHLVRDQLEKLQTQFSTAITSPTFAMAEVVRSHWRTTEIQVIPNFFSPKSYTPDLTFYETYLKGKQYILFFGRLEYRKGVHVLAEALPQVLQQHSGISAVFVGSDSVYNSDSMRNFISRELKGFENRVSFMDNIPHAALYPIIERAKIVVLPSLWENFPYVCLETMSLGKAVVASNSGGFPEIIEDGKEGFLCEPGDPNSLRDAILGALSTHNLGVIEDNARKKAERFDMRVVEDTVEFYRSIQIRARAGAGKPKIAYVLRHIPVPSETFVINEILALQSAGLEILPISLLPAQRCHESLMAQIREPVLNLDLPDLTKRAQLSPNFEMASSLAVEYKVPSSLGAQAAMVADCVQNKAITHLHAHFATESAWVALIASRITGIPFSFTAHAYDIFMRDPNIIKEDSLEARVRILIQQCAKAFTISRYNKEHILSLTDPSFAKKIEIIRCGINTERFVSAVRDTHGTVRFLSVGRFVEKKGFEFLLSSFEILTHLHDNVELKIIGEGHRRQAIMELADSLGIAAKVKFLGAVSSDVVMEEMKASDVFALHSVTAANGDKEGIPVSIMEASAVCLPIISTIHSGIPELVVNGVTGFLSEERDVESFANSMLALATSPQLRKRMGEAGRRHVLTHFNQKIEAEKLAGAFIRLSDESSSLSSSAIFVDIIMPTYRPNLDYLKRAIQSILDQTYSNWQLYLIQDGDDYDLQQLIREISDDRIHYFQIPHMGKPRALNFALSKGSSKYIAYLDDDDIWYPNHLQETISYMAKTGAKFVHTDSHEIFISAEGGRFEEISRRSLNKGIITNKTLWYISHINAVHERELLASAGTYNESLPFFIDWDMFQRLAKYAKPHHIAVFTCEHYMYLNKDKIESNTISSAHKKDPELSSRMHNEMFKKSFQLLTSDDFAEFVRDWQSKNSQLEERNTELQHAKQRLQTEFDQILIKKEEIIQQKQEVINALLNSLSWKVSAPLRWGYEKITKLLK